MRTIFTSVLGALSASLMAFTPLAGCGPSAPTTPPAAGGGDDHGHGEGDGHEAEPTGHGHGGAVIALGQQLIGSFDARATRDEGAIIAGRDAAIDVTVAPVAGSDARPVAVRFWIGVESGEGSIKARGEIEDPNDPNRWHTHVEVPSPLPAGSMLWVEIEAEGGAISLGSFALNM